MDVMIAPVSGRVFPCQVAACKLLAEGGYRPRITIGASGGAITAYIMEAAQWDANRVDSVLNTMSSDLFITKPRIPFIGKAISMFAGSVFKFNPDAEKHIQTILTDAAPFKCEIWTGSFEKDIQKGIYACNIEESNCLLALDKHDILNANLMTPVYCNQNVTKLAKYILSSWSIASVFPSVEIEGHRYSDPGMIYGSPISGFRLALLRMALREKVSLHFTLLSAVDLESDREPFLFRGQPTILTTLVNQIVGSIQSNKLKDRAACLDIMWLQQLQEVGAVTFKATKESLEHLTAFKEESAGTITGIYSKSFKTLNITDFTNIDLVQSVSLGGNNVEMRLRWFTKRSPDDMFQYNESDGCAERDRNISNEHLDTIIADCTSIAYYNSCDGAHPPADSAPELS